MCVQVSLAVAVAPPVDAPLDNRPPLGGGNDTSSHQELTHRCNRLFLLSSVSQVRPAAKSRHSSQEQL